MDNKNELFPSYIDFPEYNELSQSGLWPVIVKYKGQPEIHFSISKSDTLKAFCSIEEGTENDEEGLILIGSRSFEREGLSYIVFEGRTYSFNG